MNPKVFISYSWDCDGHKEWVRELATRMRTDGADVMLDQWHVAPGDQLPEFMERAVRENDLILIVCTPHYKEKSDKRIGGVGYEGDIMTAEVFSKRNHRKFIPVVRNGREDQCLPAWLKGKYYVDLSDNPYSERQYSDLLATIHNQRTEAPPIGKVPYVERVQINKNDLTKATVTNIIITGVVVDEVTTPKHDGTTGCALYRIPFQLSSRPSAEWQRVFLENWDRPPRYTTMHRPGIASVIGTKVYLNGTTIEEVEKYHRDTLLLAVDAANRTIIGLERQKEQARLAEETRQKEHKDEIKSVAERLKF